MSKEYYAVVPTIRAAKNEEEVRNILVNAPFNIPKEAVLPNVLLQARIDKNHPLIYVITQAMYRLRYL